MSKICVITDLHFGIKKSNELFLENSLNCFRKEIIPYLKKNKINTMYVLGDIFDNRTQINVKVKNAVYQLFDEDLSFLKNITLLVGNHDTFHKTSIEVHSLKMFKKFHNVEVIEDIILKEVDNNKFLFVPWQTDYNAFKVRVAEKNIHCDVCFGHFDINNCYMNKLSSLTNEGVDSDIFYNNYSLTVSGHFHLRSKNEKNGNKIIYVGTPYELNRNDKNEPKGFMLLDTETLDYEFIDTNKYLKFVDVHYPDKPTKKHIEGNIVDVYVTIDKEFNDLNYQAYMKYLNCLNPLQINPITKYAIFNSLEEAELSFNVKPLMESVFEYIDKMLDLSESDKSLIYEKMENTYNEVRTL